MKKVVNFVKDLGPAALAVSTPFLAFAQGGGAGGNITTPPQSGAPQSTSIQSLADIMATLCNVFTWIFIFLLVLAGIFILIAAFKYLTAAGNPEAVKSAGTMLIYTAVAVGVALLARAIPFIVASFLGSSVVGYTC